MELVQPIRDVKLITDMKRKLTNPRDRLLFIFGINSGLRISDILLIRVCDVRGKTTYTLREKKTGKTKSFPLNRSIQKALSDFFSRYNDLPPDAPIFHSRKKKDGQYRPITRQRAYEIINSAARSVGITDQIGTHTLRKTWGYHAYNAGVDLPKIMQILNHSSQKVTLRYIGVTQDEIDDVYNNVCL